MDKSIIGQKPQRIKIKADKSPKTENNLILQQLNCTIPFLFMRSRGTGVHNPNSVHMIKWWDWEKPNGQKHHRTKAPRINIKADKSPTNPENILILHKSRCTIPFLFMWSRDTGVHIPHSVNMIMWWDREKPNGQKHHRPKAPRIKIKADKSPKKPKNILIFQQSRITITFLFMWSRDTGGGTEKSPNGQKPQG